MQSKFNLTPAKDHLPRVYIAIPARLSSTRLSEKLIQKIGDETVIERTTNRAIQLKTEIEKVFSSQISHVSVMVAIDAHPLEELLRNFPVKTVMTSPFLKSGTDRICEGLSLLPETEKPRDMDIVLNTQGDEPFFSVTDSVQLTRQMLSDAKLPMGTLGFERRSTELFLKSSVVKIVINSDSRAVYFSRAPIPWPRQAFGATGQDWLEKCKNSEDILFLQHLGVYAFRFHALKTFAHSLPESSLETSEGLEQLRAVEAGWSIVVVKANDAPFGIDTHDDLDRARMYCEQNKEI